MSRTHADILAEVNNEELRQTIEWLTRETPYRLAGSPCQKKAAEYVTQRLRDYGLDADYDEFYAYNSDPLSSRVQLVEPVQEEIASLPCAHIRATAPQGELLELVYVSDGSVDAYQGLDVRGKMVLVEVSYAPPVPEKARIAASLGAAGVMCMNWGNDEEVICHRGLKGVWGNPTAATFDQIPDIIGVGVTRLAGLRLKELCQSGQRVLVRVTAIADRKWSLIQQPHAVLRGNGKRDDFILLCSHLDAWQPGVTCNATGNATTLEICRILSQRRDLLDRDIHIAFWSGHEIAEAAGSTWFVDNYWDLLQKHCVCYIHVDSTGVRDTKIFEIKASGELLDFAANNYTQLSGNSELRSMTLKKIGDQSFMGVGVPAVTQRLSFTQADMEQAHGATLGWWNHTCEDGLDKCDMDILHRDTEATLALVLGLATAPLLPYDFSRVFAALQGNLRTVIAQARGRLALDDVAENLSAAQAAVAAVQAQKERFAACDPAGYDKYVRAVSRLLSNVALTCADKYQQDSYGYTPLSAPIPLLAEVSRLDGLAADTLEYGLIHTQLVKNKNRLSDALYQVCELSELTLRLLDALGQN